MLPDRVSNPGPPTYKSGALPIALPGPAIGIKRLLTLLISKNYQNIRNKISKLEDKNFIIMTH